MTHHHATHRGGYRTYGSRLTHAPKHCKPPRAVRMLAALATTALVALGAATALLEAYASKGTIAHA
jgi:hypothetical protein